MVALLIQTPKCQTPCNPRGEDVMDRPSCSNLAPVEVHLGDSPQTILFAKLVQRMCVFLEFEGAHRALCMRCAKSRLFFTTGSHGSQGPEFCTPDAVFEWIVHASIGGWFSGVLPG